jgi:hypothetical protein
MPIEKTEPICHFVGPYFPMPNTCLVPNQECTSFPFESD